MFPQTERAVPERAIDWPLTYKLVVHVHLHYPAIVLVASHMCQCCCKFGNTFVSHCFGVELLQNAPIFHTSYATSRALPLLLVFYPHSNVTIG